MVAQKTRGGPQDFGAACVMLKPVNRRAPSSPLTYAVLLLSRREYFAKELATRIARKFPQEDAAPALEKLQEQGLQSDERCAQMRARALYQSGKSARAAVQAMTLAGCAPELAEAAASEIMPQEQETERLKIILEQKSARLPSDTPADVRREKLFRFGASRGFSIDQLTSALADLFAGFSALEEAD